MSPVNRARSAPRTPEVRVVARPNPSERTVLKLMKAAEQIRARAHARYSGFRVGAALLGADGKIYTGCNVENASYGLTLCAECGLVSALHASGGGRLVALACVDGSGSVLMPCGRCRQLIWEHGGAECLLDTPAGIVPMRELLPQAFGPGDLSPGRS